MSANSNPFTARATKVACTAIVAVSFGFAAGLLGGWTTHDENGVIIVVVPTDLTRVMFLALLVGCACAWWALRRRGHGGISRVGLSAAIGGTMGLIALYGSLFIGYWEVTASAQRPGGKRLAVLQRRVVRLTRILLVEQTQSYWTLDEYRSVAGTYGQSTFVRLVRRMDECNLDHALVVGRAELAVVLFDERCIMAVDLMREKALDSEALVRLSPFVLLEDSAEGCDADLRSILESVVHVRKYVEERSTTGALNLWGLGLPDGSRAPPEEEVVQGLGSENAWVRDASAQIAVAGGRALYPVASSLLDEPR